MEGRDRQELVVMHRLLKSQQPNLKCPRCNSVDTTFGYFNNYNISQPRYLCKTCKRYWTHGGKLRQVPGQRGVRKVKPVQALAFLPWSHYNLVVRPQAILPYNQTRHSFVDNSSHIASQIQYLPSIHHVGLNHQFINRSYDTLWRDTSIFKDSVIVSTTCSHNAGGTSTSHSNR